MNVRLSGFLIYFLFLIETGMAQPQANFIVDRYNICSGTNIQLTNTSSGANRFEWLIDGMHYSFARDTAAVLTENCYTLTELKLIAEDTLTHQIDSTSIVVEVFDTCFFHWTGTFLNCPGDTILLAVNPEEINTLFSVSNPISIVSGCFTCPSLEFILSSPGTTVDRTSTYIGECTEITTYEYFCTVTNINDVQYSGISAYPNPVRDYLTITSNAPQQNCILIKDTKGQSIHQTMITEPSTRIDLTDLSAGVYILHVFSETGAPYVSKFIKE